MNSSAKAQDYARILFQVGEEKGILTDILYEINNFRKIQVKDVNELLLIPVVSKEIKMDLISSLEKFEISKELLNFVKILVSRNDFSLFLEIIEEFKILYQEKEDIQVVNIYVAKKLDSESQNILVSELESRLNKFVVLSTTVEPNLIGGIKIEYNGKEIDNTIKKHLNDFSNYLVRS